MTEGGKMSSQCGGICPHFEPLFGVQRQLVADIHSAPRFGHLGQSLKGLTNGLDMSGLKYASKTFDERGEQFGRSRESRLAASQQVADPLAQQTVRHRPRPLYSTESHPEEDGGDGVTYLLLCTPA